jgi:hypothetical protein
VKRKAKEESVTFHKQQEVTILLDSIMVKEKETYATVAHDEDGDDEEEAAGIDESMEEEQFHVPDGVQNSATTHAQTTSRWKIALGLLIAFVAGLAIGNESSRNAAWSVMPLGISSGSSSSNSSTEQSCGDAATVSYGFLQTTRGTQLQETLHEELMAQSPKIALQHMQVLMDEDDQIANSCHPLTHMLGRNALMELGFDQAWGGMVGTEDASLLRICNAAYMHGIIEHYLAASENLVEDVAMITDTICKKLTNVKDGVWECHHGVGHGIIQHYRTIKEKETLTQAIEACGNTTFAKDCENGLWMDHFASTKVSGMLEPSSLHVCRLSIADVWACGTYSPTEYLLHHPRAYSEAVQFCLVGFIDDVRFSNTCVKGVGTQAAKENIHDYWPVEVAGLTVPENLQSGFFHQALNYYKMSTGSDIPTSMCENLVVFKDQCMDATKEYP